MPRIVLAAIVAVAAAGPLAAQGSRAVALVDTTLPQPRRGDVLGRLISLRLNDVTLETALARVEHLGGLRLSYSSNIVPVARRVSVARERCPVGEVLQELLRGTDIDVVVTPSGYVVLVRNPGYRLPAVAGSGGDGAAALAPPEVRTIAARPQVMDRVIVMGAPATGAPERELASAVTVMTAEQIAATGATTMGELLRSGIPGVVAWDLSGSGPFAQLGSVRGSSSFTANYLKTYVDGVELASPYLLFAVDPYSIERIEIIRGPQGSALYGSDAISGVVQIVTRRGSPAANWHPHTDAMLSGGLSSSRFVDRYSERQRHSVLLTTGGGTTSLDLGGTYAAAGEIVPGGGSGYRGTFGGFTHVAGDLRTEATFRYADVLFSAPENPLLRGQDLPATLSAPTGQQRIEDETYGLTLDLQPGTRLRHTLVLGVDRHAGAIPPQREPATVADALLGATQERVIKGSLRYTSSLRLIDRGETSTTLTVGVDRSQLVRERLGFKSDVTGAGEGLAALYHDDIANTGVYGQARVDIARSLFLTGGIRGEQNSTFGEDYGTAWSPMLGAVFTRDVGRATIKLRAAYGKGLRPPAPSARQAISTVKFRQLANPDLQPETQSGFEGGMEWYLSDRASLSVTAYTQDADGLIQQVIVNPETEQAIQYQNVGRIANRGMEIEAAGRVGALRGNLTFALTSSRVRALSSTYSGDLVVGDRVPEVPRSSGQASLSWRHGQLELSAGTTYIGAWPGYDWAAYYSSQAGDTLATTAASYRREYPALIKPFVGVTRSFGDDFEWFGRVDNLTNVQRNERDNLQITPGRTVSVGVRLRR